MEEIWRDIPGHEGAYQVSNLGRVRSLTRRVRCCGFADGRPGYRTMKGKVLRPGRMPSGHMSVVLGRHGNGATVHSLVMLAFVGPPPEGKEVCHNDGDPANNCLDNLRYDTRRENILDAIKGGTYGRNRLEAKDIPAIRARLAAGERGADIARELGISHSTISAIKHRRAWAWVP